MKNLFLLFALTLFIFASLSRVKAQEIDIDNIPNDMRENLLSLISLNKNENYKALIDLAKLYKKQQPEFANYYTGFIVHAHFELREFDRVIELSEPYVKEGKVLLMEGNAEASLGQAYIQKNRIEEGCELLLIAKSKSVDAKLDIVYASNCLEFEEIAITVSGRKQDTPSNLIVEEGDVVTVEASGKVVYGMFAGSAGPKGFENGAYKNYNRAQNKNHGELFFTVSSDPHLFYDIGYLHRMASSGRIIFHINDKDVSNNSGAFKTTIRVYK